MSHIRKAIVAGLGAGFAALVAAYDGGISVEEVGTIAAAIAVTGYGTYRVRNEPPLAAP